MSTTRAALRRSLFAGVLPLVVAGLSPCPAHAAWSTEPTQTLPIREPPGFLSLRDAIPDQAGGMFVVWVEGDRVRVQHVLAEGLIDPQWPDSGLSPTTSTLGQATIVACSDGANGLLVAWIQGATSSPTDVFAQHILAQGVVDAAWPADGVLLCSSLGWKLSLGIVSDLAGGAIVSWQDQRASATLKGDVYAHRVLAAGTADPAWPVNGLLVASNAYDQMNPYPVTDGSGGAVIIWEEWSVYDLYAQHVLPSGIRDPAWPAGGVVIAAQPNDQWFFSAVSDGDGGVFVAWEDNRSGPFSNRWDIYAHHVLKTGVVDSAWPVNGRGVCLALQGQLLPAIAPDGLGGIFVTWRDMRSGGPEIFAQHVFGSGEVDPDWPVNGYGIRSGEYPSMTGAGPGAAIVVWGDTDVYALRLDEAQVWDQRWAGNGEPICILTGEQQAPRPVHDGAGGAIFVWTDLRNGPTHHDIHAHHIGADGQLGPSPVAVEPGPRSGIDLAVPRPNPMTRGERSAVAFRLERAARCVVEIHDAAGRRHRVLAAGRTEPGEHILSWDGADESGHRVRPGLYFLRLTVDGERVERKLVVL